MYHNKSLPNNIIHNEFKDELTNPNGSFAKFIFNSKNLRLFTKSGGGKCVSIWHNENGKCFRKCFLYGRFNVIEHFVNFVFFDC